MDQAINLSDAPLSGLEMEFFDLLAEGILPEWFQAMLDGSASSPGGNQETEGTLDAHGPNDGFTTSEVPASDSTTSSVSSAILDAMPPQAVSSLAHLIGASGGEPVPTTSEIAPSPTTVRNVAKRRLSDHAIFVQAKRVRKPTKTATRIHASQETFGPHFLGPNFPYYASQPLSMVAHPGPYMAAGPFAGAAPIGMATFAPPGITGPFLPPASSYYTLSTSFGVPWFPAYPLAGPAPSPFTAPAKRTKQQAHRTGPNGERAHTLKPTFGMRLENSEDPARQRTIEAHRANDARENDTDDIICLWIDVGAAEPCHQSFQGTNALLTHCVEMHGVPSAKTSKEVTNCSWSDCSSYGIRKSALKRHLAEHPLHGRRDRLPPADTRAKIVEA
ncbi:hypothetical protein D9619_013071 [Psilocybe cf. subviscida]|uniref:Uncharacterized protein n=1 Tax=Psilocybe cf. subviscida TaxID=2480587 RepID=A0A8H5EV89_9AGAR|nr:hypothetical protein D9619_013071 [Psilocybe cf. subviscida]